MFEKARLRKIELIKLRLASYPPSDLWDEKTCDEVMEASRELEKLEYDVRIRNVI